MIGTFPHEIILAILEFVTDIKSILNSSLVCHTFNDIYLTLSKDTTFLPIVLIRFFQTHYNRDSRQIIIYYGHKNSIRFRLSMSRIDTSFFNCMYDDNKLIFRCYTRCLIYDCRNLSFGTIDSDYLINKYSYKTLRTLNQNFVELEIKGHCSTGTQFYFVGRGDESYYAIFDPSYQQYLQIDPFPNFVKILSLDVKFQTMTVFFITEFFLVYKVSVDFTTAYISQQFLGKIHFNYELLHNAKDVHYLDEDFVLSYHKDRFLKYPINKNYQIKENQNIRLTLKKLKKSVRSLLFS